MKKSKSINDLTNDDSKILGTITDKKLEKLSNKNHFHTSQFKTMYSNWTPVANKTYNKQLFQERNELIFNWFDVWTDHQRNEFLTNLFLRCSPSQFSCIYNYFDKKIPLKKVDFTRIIPKCVSLKIFSYLDPRSLSRSSQVSWYWKFLSEQDVLWIPKCKRFGWYLPYSPAESEFGAWKRHYVMNAISVDISVGQIRGSVWRRLALTDNYKLTAEEKASHTNASSYMDDIIKSATTRPKWAVSNAFASDIEDGGKALFAGLNPNENIMETLAKQSISSVKSSPRPRSGRSKLTARDIKDKISLSQLLNWEERRMTEIIDGYKNTSTKHGKTAETTEDKRSDIVKLGNTEVLPWQRPSLGNMYQLSSIVSGYSGWANPRVIFISSKLPAAEMLLDSVIFGVIPIPYDYDSTTLKTMIYDLQSVLRGRRAMSIGLFGHRNKDNEMWIVRNKCLSRKNITAENPDLQEFINNLAANVLPTHDRGHVDLFAPFGAFDAGNDLLININDLTKSTFTAPISAIGQYTFITGNWTTHPENDVHPCFAYFVINKLNAWIEFSEAISEIVYDTKVYLKHQYPEIDEVLVKQLTGSIIREAATLNPNIDVKEIIQSICKPLFKCSDENPLLAVHKHLTKILFEKSQTPGQEIDKNQSNAVQESSVKPIAQKRSKDIDAKPLTEVVASPVKLNRSQHEFPLRKSIVNELVLNEKRHVQILKSIRDFYYTPLKKALSSNRAVLGPHNIQLIFGDILLFLDPSENLIRNLETRLNQWSMDQCIGDLLENYANDLSMIFGSFFLSYSNSLTNLERCRETNIKFRNFLSRHENQPESGMLSLGELFLRPTCRIGEYVNIVHWILSNTPPEHNDIGFLKRTLVGLSKINSIIVQENARITKAMKFQEVQNTIINCPLLMEPGRYFVTRENLTLFVPSSNSKSVDPDLKYYHQAKDCGIFVFNDALIMSRITREIAPYRRNTIFDHSFEQAMALSKISLLDIPDRKDINFAFQIRYGNRMWILGCHSIEKKYHLTTILKQYIQLCTDE